MIRSVLQLALPFRPRDNALSEGKKRQIQTCRLLCLLGFAVVVLVGSVRTVLPVQTVTPFWVHLLAGGVLAALFVGTYVSTWVRDWVRVLTELGFYDGMVWVSTVVVLNHTAGGYAMVLLLVYAVLTGGVGLVGGSMWGLAGFGLAAVAVGVAVSPAARTPPLIVLVTMATAGVVVCASTQAHLAIQTYLREQRAQWRGLMEQLQEAVLITVGGEVAYANPRAAALFGTSDTEGLQGQSVYDLVAPGARAEVQERLQSLEDEAANEPHEYRTVGRDGEERVVQSQSVPVQYEGGEAALTVVRDVTDWRETQRALTRQAHLERLIVEVSAGFIDTPIEGLDAAIEDALGTIGDFVGADRSYVFQFSGHPGAETSADATTSNTHEWCAPGVESQKEDLQQIPCDHIGWWMEQIRTLNPLGISSVADLPDAAAAEQEMLEAQNVRSLVAFPMTHEGDLVGFVGFDAVKEPVDWDDETATILRVLGDAITSALQRKDVEERLRDREERLRAITENVSEAIYRSTAEDGLVYANQTFADLFGYDSPEEVLEIDPSTLYASSEAREELRRAAREQDSFEKVEVEFQRADGSSFVGLMSGSVVRGPEGGVLHYDGAITDITDRKRRERRLRVLSETVEQAENGILITEAGSPERIVYANPAFERMTGYAEEELQGCTPEVLQGPETDLEVIESLAEARAAGESWVGETVNYRKDGTPFLVQWTAVPVRDEAGEIEYWTAVQRDVTEQRDMEERLREREGRLRGLANSLPGVVYQFYARPDGSNGTHFVGDHAESLLGISADPDQFFERFVAGVPASYRETLLESVDEAVQEEAPWRFEMPFETPSGERIWLLGTATPQQRADELIYNGVLLDITDRKHAERAVQEERDRFETLFESLPTPVVRCTAEDDGILIADVNEAFESVFGVGRSEAENSALDALLVPDSTRAAGIDRRALTEGAVKTDVRCETADGIRDFRIQVAGRKPESGPPEGHAIYTDVTARKRRERALKEANATLEAILENLPYGVLAENDKGAVLAANESFCSILGLEVHAADLRGDSAEEVRHRMAKVFDDPAAFIDRTDTVLDRGQPVFEEEVPLVDGRVVEWDFVPYEIAGGTAVLWVYRDITERKEREERLREAKEEAQEANRMKSVFLANMSHEIRTPLTSMIGFAEVIGDEVADDDEGPIPRFAGLIEESGHRLMETLDAVLNLSKLETGEMELAAEEVCLTDEVEETAELFGPQAEEAGIDLQVQTPDRSLLGRADPGGLRIVLRNLISNALKYTEEGSVWVRAEQRNGGAAIEVEDTGIGMDPDETSSLFEAFRQESEGMSREYEGSGLGLAVTKRVVDQMSGTIEVDTEKGGGTRFTVHLPMDEQSTEVEGADGAAPRGR